MLSNNDKAAIGASIGIGVPAAWEVQRNVRNVIDDRANYGPPDKVGPTAEDPGFITQRTDSEIAKSESERIRTRMKEKYGFTDEQINARNSASTSGWSFDDGGWSEPLDGFPYERDAKNIPNVTHDGDLGKYHNAVNEANIQAADLHDELQQNPADTAKLNTLSANMKAAATQAKTIYDGLSPADKTKAKAEDGAANYKTTPATDSAFEAKLYVGAVGANPELIGKAQSALEDGLKTGKSSAEIAANVGKFVGEGVKCAGAASVVAGPIIAGAFDIKDAVDAARGGDKGAEGKAIGFLFADILSFGFASLYRDGIEGALHDQHPHAIVGRAASLQALQQHNAEHGH